MPALYHIIDTGAYRSIMHFGLEAAVRRTNSDTEVTRGYELLDTITASNLQHI